ncbi:MAG: DUF4129 domain-containing protein [Dehalococcoidales bacterium]
MKKLAIILSIITLLVLFSPGLSIFAQPTHISHENPAAAKSSPEPTALLFFYSKTLDLTAIRQYHDAHNILNKLEEVNIPDELQYIIDRYGTLPRELLTTLNTVEFLLDEASTLFSNNQISDARQKLDYAEAGIQDAQFLLDDMEAATNAVGNRLGIFAASATSQLKQAYDRLEQSLRRLRDLTNKLEQLLQNLELDPLMVIKTSFYQPTFLEVSAPEIAYPGLPITISGQVSSTNDNIERTIKVLWDNTQLAKETVRDKFSLKITPPPQTSTGEHSLSVVAIPQGRCLGAEKSLSINILRLPIQTDAQVPQLIILPKLVQISGKVTYNFAPVQDARVSLALGQSLSTVKTATDGSFTADISLLRLSVPTSVSANPFFATTTTAELPFDLSLVGPRQLTLTIEPVEPWYAPLQIKRWVFTVNPLNIGLMLIASLSLGLLIYSQVRTRLPRRREEKVIPQPRVRELPAVTPALELKPKFTGTRGRILSAYISGLETVEKMTSLSMAAHTTLREFLKTATTRLPTAIKPFTELTTIAEVALYSARKLDENIATRAEQLATTIKEELHSEAT